MCHLCLSLYQFCIAITCVQNTSFQLNIIPISIQMVVCQGLQVRKYCIEKDVEHFCTHSPSFWICHNRDLSAHWFWLNSCPTVFSVQFNPFWILLRWWGVLLDVHGVHQLLFLLHLLSGSNVNCYIKLGFRLRLQFTQTGIQIITQPIFYCWCGTSITSIILEADFIFLNCEVEWGENQGNLAKMKSYVFNIGTCTSQLQLISGSILRRNSSKIESKFA